jgi:hypothetical protein
MKMNYKKSLKFATLLIASLLIATVSAEVYNYLSLSANVGVEGLTLEWDDTGLDSGLSATIYGATCTISGLKGPVGGTRTYSKAIGLKATANGTFDIEVVSVTGTGGSGTDALDSIVVRIYDEGNVSKGNLTVWASGAKGTTPVTDLQIQNGDVWRLAWEITWKSSAQVGDTVTVALKVTTPSPP